MPLVVALIVIVAIIVVLWLAIGHDPGPSAVDAATAYTLARARGDWSTVYDLSAKELRGGRDREHFVAAHRHDDASDHPAAGHGRATVEHSTVATDAAVVVIHLDDPDLVLRLGLERRDMHWVVTEAVPA